MALVYPNATLEPGKRDLIDAWLPTQPWYDGEPRKPTGSFRFDDPAGEVGMEGFLLGGADTTLFVPLTYRSEELDGGTLVGTTQHSELGLRFVYDGCSDPVFVQALATAIVTGATGVDHEYDLGNGPESRPTNAQVRGTGSAASAPAVSLTGTHDEGPLTIVNAGPLELVVARVAGTSLDAAESRLVTWKGGEDVPLVGVRPG